MPRNPPNETTANMMLLDSLSRTMSSTSPILRPDLSWTDVPQTLVARMTVVWPLAVGMADLQCESWDADDGNAAREGLLPAVGGSRCRTAGRGNCQASRARGSMAP